jgi:hypothetical protein
MKNCKLKRDLKKLQMLLMKIIKGGEDSEQGF